MKKEKGRTTRRKMKPTPKQEDAASRGDIGGEKAGY